MLTVLLGGARSGKSALALDLARRHDGPVAFVVTSPRIPDDHDLEARIAAHRAERPAAWSTIEEQHDLAGALAAVEPDALVVVDCLTLWTSNLMWRGDDEATIDALAADAASTASTRSAPTIVVTNEVGLGVHPETELGRRYRDALGRVNRRWTAVADRALLLVAGRAVPLVDPHALLDGALS